MPTVFFYGSFINREVLERAGFVPAEAEVACLWGFDIRIEPTANIVPADGCCVYGTICQASHAELSRLYGQEWLGAYLPEAAIVATRDGALFPALVYIAPQRKPAPASDGYLDRIIGPARELRFPSWYLERLEKFRQSPGPHRREAERASGRSRHRIAAERRARSRRQLARTPIEALSVLGAWRIVGNMSGADAGTGSQLHELYARAQAARSQSRLLAGQFHAAQDKVHESLQYLRTARDRAEQIRQLWLAAYPERERLRYSATARLQARLATMPVIEQAKGIVMAQFDWTADQAFDALRRASQRENIKLRDLAARIVATTARPDPAQPAPGHPPVAAHRHGRRAAG